MRPHRTLALAALLAVLLGLAGCSAPTAGDARPDPVTDQQGWENGYWYDDPLAVSTEDGLSARELDAVVARTMARVERIRGLEFQQSVSVEVISRSEYREEYGGVGPSATSQWDELVWEALWLVDEDTTVDAALGGTFDATVRGFYAPDEGAIVIVSDSARPTIDRWTLAHELVHAVQDQHLDLGGYPPTQDRRRARNGVVEGDANLVARLYERRCAAGWDCLDRPNRTGGGGDINLGAFLTVYTPYAVGPSFVGSVRNRSGWAGVDALYEDYPTSTEQLIHPAQYPDEEPRDVYVPDRSSERWSRFDHDPEGETVGEAAIYAMFRANGQVGQNHSTYDYDHPLSAGWAGDTLVPYRDGDHYGYVWVTAWDSTADAHEFEQAYRALLDNRSTRTPGPNTSVVPDSDPFGDAFRVTRDGTRVRIVNGPTVRSLYSIHNPD